MDITIRIPFIVYTPQGVIQSKPLQLPQYPYSLTKITTEYKTFLALKDCARTTLLHIGRYNPHLTPIDHSRE